MMQMVSNAVLYDEDFLLRRRANANGEKTNRDTSVTRQELIVCFRTPTERSINTQQPRRRRGDEKFVRPENDDPVVVRLEEDRLGSSLVEDDVFTRLRRGSTLSVPPYESKIRAETFCGRVSIAEFDCNLTRREKLGVRRACSSSQLVAPLHLCNDFTVRRMFVTRRLGVNGPVSSTESVIEHEHPRVRHRNRLRSLSLQTNK